MWDLGTKSRPTVRAAITFKLWVIAIALILTVFLSNYVVPLCWSQTLASLRL